jgi:hypothetical protein
MIENTCNRPTHRRLRPGRHQGTRVFICDATLQKFLDSKPADVWYPTGVPDKGEAALVSNKEVPGCVDGLATVMPRLRHRRWRSSPSRGHFCVRGFLIFHLARCDTRWVPEGTRVACAIICASIAKRRAAYERGAVTTTNVFGQRHCWIVRLFRDRSAWCR